MIFFFKTKCFKYTLNNNPDNSSSANNIKYVLYYGRSIKYIHTHMYMNVYVCM